MFEIRVSNTTQTPATFYLEPWGGRYTVRPNSALRVVLESASAPVLEWEIAEDVHVLAVHNPPGVTATVFDGDSPARAE